jgi:uncharacterized protein DUF222
VFKVDPREALADAAQARQMASYHTALELQWLAVYARAHDTDSVEDSFAHLEVAALLHISDQAARERMRFARVLIDRLNGTYEALWEGRIEEYKAKLIADAVGTLSDEHAELVEERVLAKAAEQTPAQLRAALAKAVLEVDPEGAEARRQKTHRERRVYSQPTGDGQAVLSIYHDATRIAVLRAALRGRALQLRVEPDESRTLEQIEADLAADLLLGREESLKAVEVHLTMPATTAAGHDNKPAEFEGVGPITAQEARQWAAEATSWRWLRTDPDTGVVVDLTAPSYRPPAAMATFIKVRDRTCRFPGCVRPARRCDVDHRVPWPAGATGTTNCACLCRRHHRAKHDGGWRMEALKPGWYRWISPHGLPYDVAPDPVDDPDPPPF